MSRAPSLHNEKTSAPPPVASEIARHIRSGLEAEEIVDLWNVVFPEDRNVWYDEEAKSILFNEEFVGYGCRPGLWTRAEPS